MYTTPLILFVLIKSLVFAIAMILALIARSIRINQKPIVIGAKITLESTISHIAFYSLWVPIVAAGAQYPDMLSKGLSHPLPAEHIKLALIALTVCLAMLVLASRRRSLRFLTAYVLISIVCFGLFWLLPDVALYRIRIA